MNRLIKLISLLVVATFVIGCGARKAKIDNYKVNVVTEEQSKLKVDSSQKTVAKVEEKSEIKTKVENDIKQKDVKTEIKEVFKDGELTERTTTTTITDKVDNSKTETTEEKSKKSATIKETINKIEKTANKVVDSLFKSKSKDVDANTTLVKNIGGWSVMIVTLLIIIASLWYWLGKRKQV